MSFATMDLSAFDLTLSNHRKAELKTCLEDITKLEEEDYNNIEKIDGTEKILNKVDNLYKEADTSSLNFGESYLDSQVLCATSYLAMQCADATSGNLYKYDRHDLASHIKENPHLWEFKLPYEASQVPYLDGIFESTSELPPKVPRKRVERQAAAPVKVPNNIASLDTSTITTEKIVNKVHHFLERACRSGPLCYFQVALDPTSFSKTVENIYYLSFLVKDGRLEVFLDGQTGLPRIKTRPPEEQDIDKETHFIASIDEKLWKELVEAFNIKRAMMVIEKE